MNEAIGFYTKSQVLELTTFGNSTLWRRVKSNDFPPPVQISRGRVAWPRHTVHEWLRQHGAAPANKEAA